MVEITSIWNNDYFSPRSQPSYVMSKLQRYMAKRLFDEIQLVLKEFSANKFFKDIAILLPEDRIHYTREGRKLPKTTDLSYGLPVTMTDKHKIRVYGDFFTQGVGAIQMTTTGELSTFDIFEELVRLVHKRKLKIQTVSYVEGGRVKEPVIYISNEKRLIYNEKFARRFSTSRKFTVSKNGGVTRTIYIPKLSK